MRSPSTFVWVTTIAVAVLFGSCSVDPRGVVRTPDGPIIDGWHIGEEVGGPIINDRPCGDPEIIQAATDALDLRDFAHPQIVDVSLHAERTDSPNYQWSTVPRLIVVFDLAHGGARAIGVRWAFCSGRPQVTNFGR